MPAKKAKSQEIRRLERKLTKELLWIYILSILKKKKMHAYALRKEIKKRFDFLPGNVSAYVVLYKLESRGFVSVKAEGTRKIYSLTASGKKLLNEAKGYFRSVSKKAFS